MRGLNNDRLNKFRESLSGPVIAHGDKDYDAARAVWNGMIDRRPAIVVRPIDSPDVISALRLARDAGLEIAVRGGGHSLPGFSTCDDGIVIDLSGMRGVSVDKEKMTARVGGGVVLGELDAAAQAVGLVCPVGAVANTGVAGLTLGGGMGWLQRRFGLTIDSLIGVEMVTADGVVVGASDKENPELLWGMRGAGANLGIVTSFDFRLHEFGPDVTAGTLVYPMEQASNVLPAIRDLALEAPDDLLLTIGTGRAPDQGAFSPDLLGRRYLSVGVMHAGTQESAEHDLLEVRGVGSPSMDTIARISYIEKQREADPLSQWGSLRAYAKSRFISELPTAAIDLYIDLVSEAPDGCGLSAWTWGGAIAQTSEDATAFTGRDAAFWFAATGFWTDPALDEVNIGWARAAMEALEPFMRSTGYVNDQVETGTDVVRAIYGDAKYERLAGLKRIWDPDNVFHLNQNIRP